MRVVLGRAAAASVAGGLAALLEGLDVLFRDPDV